MYISAKVTRLGVDKGDCCATYDTYILQSIDHYAG